MKRFVVFPLPIAGHIIPMLHLSKALVSHKDVAVTFVTTPRKYSEVLEILSQITNSSPEQILEIVTTPDGLGDDWRSGTGIKVVEEVMISMMQQQAEFEILFKKFLDEGPISCIISDFLMDWTQDVAIKFGVPRAGFWTSSSTYLLLLLEAPKLHADGFIPVKDISSKEFIPFIKGVPRLRAQELPYSIQDENPADPEFQWAVSSIRKQLQGADWIMVNTFDELEDANPTVMDLTRHKFVTLGPLLPRPGLVMKNGEKKPATLEWLDNKRPKSVLYVSFGSLASLESLHQLQSLAFGLQDSKQDFLWVIRDNLVDECTHEFLEEFKAKINKKHCLVVSWAPQLQILEHVAIGGFLTHCGWNSVLEAIWTGVPMLGWPRMVEQNLNCKFMAEIWKVGLKLDNLESDKVSGSVWSLMQGKDGKVVRDNMAKLRSASKNASRKTGQNLQAFVDSLKN